MTRVVLAYGGLGNCLNALAAAEAAGVPCAWLDQSASFSWAYACRLFPTGVRVPVMTASRQGTYVTRYPNSTPTQLGKACHPTHEVLTQAELNTSHFRRPTLFGSGQISQPVYADYGMAVPRGTIGIHARTLHPGIKVDLEEIRRRIITLAEQGPVFLSSDAEIHGLPGAVMQVPGATYMHHDSARSGTHFRKTLDELATLSRCAEIHRVSPLSTFADHLIFGGIQARRLISPAEDTAQ